MAYTTEIAPELESILEIVNILSKLSDLPESQILNFGIILS
jgi:hypothetical protein